MSWPHCTAAKKSCLGTPGIFVPAGTGTGIVHGVPGHVRNGERNVASSQVNANCRRQSLATCAFNPASAPRLCAFGMFWYVVRPPEFVAIVSSFLVSALNTATLASSVVGRTQLDAELAVLAFCRHEIECEPRTAVGTISELVERRRFESLAVRGIDVRAYPRRATSNRRPESWRRSRGDRCRWDSNP